MRYKKYWDALGREAEKVPALRGVMNRIEDVYGGWLPELWDTGEIVARYGVSKATVSRHRDEGKLKYMGRGRNIVHDRDDVEEWASKFNFGGE